MKVSFKTQMPKTGEIDRKWFVADAADQTLGRFATRVATILSGKNNAGNQVPSGIYIYRLQAGTFVQTRKMMMLK